MKASYVIAMLLLVSAIHTQAQNVLVKNGEKVAFLGDSITQFGAHSETGYVNLVISGLKANEINIKPVRAGISGHKSNQMLERLERSVLKHKPNWMLLSCGVNDVMHGTRGVKLEPYKKNITEIVDQTLTKGIKVMILTATMIREDFNYHANKKLVPYNEFLRKLAKEKNLPIADLNADMQKEVKKYQDAGGKGNALTYDGVHMDVLGDMMMAKGVLKAFGLNAEQMKKAEAAWIKLPVSYAFRPRRTNSWHIKHRKDPNVTFTLENVINKTKQLQKANQSFKQWLDNSIQQALDKEFKK